MIARLFDPAVEIDIGYVYFDTQSRSFDLDCRDSVINFAEPFRQNSKKNQRMSRYGETMY